MKKEMIHRGFTNKVKYKIGDKFVIEKTKNGFNHTLDYTQLAEFDFVPKLIGETDKTVTWQYIEGQMLENPSDEDLKEVARIMRIIHKSEISLPRNNLRRRVHAYLKIYNEKKIKVPEIDNNYREMIKLLSRMGKINPCHNDIWRENIIKDKHGKIWLVDWEYATMGDKHFDIAYFLKSFRLDDKKQQVFLDAYNSYDDYNAYIDEWIIKYKRFTAWLTCLWVYAQPEVPFDITWIKDFLKKTKP